MTDVHLDGIARFVAGLHADGYLGDPVWREVFGRVPRHVFLPRLFVPLPDGQWQAIDAAHPDYWRLVYSDTTLTTQLDGTVEPDPTTGPVAGTGTSSSTQPGLMAAMLQALRVSSGQRVLEIGTGTGYNAALLAHRLGQQNVTSVEIDPAVAEHARRRLAEAGYRPAVVTGDGEHGWAGGAPYDRLIATVAVPAVPPAWLAQIRDGGVIVTSLWRDLGGAPLVRLEVNDGTAQGFFLSQPGGFTPTGGHEQVWLFAPDGSRAMVEDATVHVEQYGPRSLWDEVEAGYDRWTRAQASRAGTGSALPSPPPASTGSGSTPRTRRSGTTAPHTADRTAPGCGPGVRRTAQRAERCGEYGGASAAGG